MTAPDTGPDPRRVPSHQQVSANDTLPAVEDKATRTVQLVRSVEEALAAITEAIGHVVTIPVRRVLDALGWAGQNIVAPVRSRLTVPRIGRQLLIDTVREQRQSFEPTLREFGEAVAHKHRRMHRRKHRGKQPYSEDTMRRALRANGLPWPIPPDLET